MARQTIRGEGGCQSMFMRLLLDAAPWSFRRRRKSYDDAARWDARANPSAVVSSRHLARLSLYALNRHHGFRNSVESRTVGNQARRGNEGPLPASTGVGHWPPGAAARRWLARASP